MRLYRVLFVCIGNSCRSQMAEAFATRDGAGILIARSAGLAPCEMVAPITREVMAEKGIDLNGATPKGLDLTGTNYDLIVNMSGRRLPGRVAAAEVREWDVEDPIWVSRERHCEIRDQIEGLVKELVGELRRRRGVRARI